MADNFPITAAKLVALFMECICYGIFLVTLAQCVRCLLWSDTENSFKKRINRPMLTVTLSMALIATLHAALGLYQNLEAFVYYTGPGGAAAIFRNTTSWITVARASTYVMQSVIGDGMLVYRCYLVYDRRWYFAVPSFLLWLAASTCGILVIVIIRTLGTGASQYASQVQPYAYSALSLTLVVNVLTTLLIVYRIWSVDRQTASMRVDSHQTSRLQSVMRILIESASLYTITVIVFFSTYVADSDANYVPSDSLVHIIGISFNLIIIRVNSGRAYEGATKWGSATAMPATHHHARPPLRISAFHRRSAKSLATANNTPLEITIRHEYIHDANSGKLELDERVPVSWSTA